MDFELKFDMGNSAFEEDNAEVEILTILKNISKKVENGQTYGPIKDTNGNTIGHWSYGE